MSQNRIERGERVQEQVEGAPGLPEVHHDEPEAHRDGGDGEELAEDRHLAERLEVVQVVGQDHHHRRGGDADEEGELRDVEAPGDVTAQAGDHQPLRELSQVAGAADRHDGEQRDDPGPVAAVSPQCLFEHIPSQQVVDLGLRAQGGTAPHRGALGEHAANRRVGILEVAEDQRLGVFRARLDAGGLLALRQPLLAQVALLDDPARPGRERGSILAIAGRGSRQLKLREPYGQAAMQYRHPMHRCQSIITMPSSRFQVAPVGHTRVQPAPRSGCRRRGPSPRAADRAGSRSSRRAAPRRTAPSRST